MLWCLQRGDAVPLIKARSSTLFADSTHCTAASDIIHYKDLDEILAEDKQLYNLIVVRVELTVCTFRNNCP